MFRYCPECDKWLETAEYTVNDIGETVCPKHDVSVYGSISKNPYGDGYPISKSSFYKQNPGYPDLGYMTKAAKKQGLVI